MLQAFRRWLRSRDPGEQTQLIVEGRIVEVGTHHPRTRLGPNQAPPEAYFRLQISRAARSDGAPQSVDRVVPPEFSGPLALLERFSVGERVRVRATTATGRQIAVMEHIPGEE